jgi:hypothetical protein
MRQEWHWTSTGLWLFYTENEYHQLKRGFFAHKRRVSALKTAEFVSDMMSYIVLRDRCYDIIAQDP